MVLLPQGDSFPRSSKRRRSITTPSRRFPFDFVTIQMAGHENERKKKEQTERQMKRRRKMRLPLGKARKGFDDSLIRKTCLIVVRLLFYFVIF